MILAGIAMTQDMVENIADMENVILKELILSEKIDL